MKKTVFIALAAGMMFCGCYFNRGVDETIETDRYTMRMVSWDMDVDGVLSSSALEEYLTDDLRTPFPLMLYTERADRFAAGIMGGRVGILIDGLPMGYLLPTTLAQFMIAPEDRVI